MFTIIETLWRLAMLIGAAFLQIGAFIAAILGVIALAFGTAAEGLRKITKNAQLKILHKLNPGRYEAKVKTTTTAN